MPRGPVYLLRLKVSCGFTIAPLTFSATIRMLTPEAAAKPPVWNSPMTSLMPILFACSVVTFAGVCLYSNLTSRASVLRSVSKYGWRFLSQSRSRPSTDSLTVGLPPSKTISASLPCLTVSLSCGPTASESLSLLGLTLSVPPSPGSNASVPAICSGVRVASLPSPLILTGPETAVLTTSLSAFSTPSLVVLTGVKSIGTSIGLPDAQFDTTALTASSALSF